MAQINKPSLYFNTKLYAGNDSTNNITGVGFQPDWVWIKNRSNSSSYNTFDAVRGATKGLYTNATDAEETVANRLSAFDSDGFTINGDTSNQTNASGSNFASWNWKANGQGSANSDGTFATTYTSANQTAGFSISKFTVSGSGNVSFGHGLGAKPKVVITKSTSHTTNWNVYHEDLSASPENNFLYLNSTAAKGTSTDVWGDGMTNSVVGLGVGIGVSVGRTYVAYCFAEKKGYSKFGSYTGNANANGTFVYTGFVPAFVLIKSTASSTNWAIIDNKRPGYNPANAAGNVLFANTNAAESSSATRGADFLSNGFKVRGTNNDVNGTSEITYMAFAENPIVGTNNIPATAR